MSNIPQRAKQSTEVRQAGLVEAALTLAAQRNPADISTTDLARAVGITQGAVFRHFPSKEAIWLAVLAWVTEQLIGRLRAAATGKRSDGQDANPLEALQAVFIAHVEFVVAHPGVPRVVFQELQKPQETALTLAVRGLMQQHRSLVMALLQGATEKDLLAPGTDLPAAAALFLGAVQGLVMQSLVSGPVESMATQAPGVFTLWLRGVTDGARP
jgi:TetR/AcrR family transcriptional regulator